MKYEWRPVRQWRHILTKPVWNIYTTILILEPLAETSTRLESSKRCATISRKKFLEKFSHHFVHDGLQSIFWIFGWFQWRKKFFLRPQSAFPDFFDPLYFWQIAQSNSEKLYLFLSLT